MKILITGSSGMVGTELQKQLKSEVIALSHENRPDIVIHLAAVTDVDWCEQNPEKCLI